MSLKTREEIEKEFDKKFVVKSNAGTDLLRYTDASLIKPFLHTQRLQDLEAVEGMVETMKLDTIDATYNLALKNLRTKLSEAKKNL